MLTAFSLLAYLLHHSCQEHAALTSGCTQLIFAAGDQNAVISVSLFSYGFRDLAGNLGANDVFLELLPLSSEGDNIGSRIGVVRHHVICFVIIHVLLETSRANAAKHS